MEVLSFVLPDRRPKREGEEEEGGGRGEGGWILKKWQLKVIFSLPWLFLGLH